MKKCCVSFLNATLMHFGAFEVIFSVLSNAAKSGITGWYGISVISILKSLHTGFYNGWMNLHSSTSRMWGSPTAMLSSICCFLVIVILFGLRRNLSTILIYIFLMTEEAESSFLMHINICISSLENYVNFISPFINQGVFFPQFFWKKNVSVSFSNSFYIPNIKFVQM